MVQVEKSSLLHGDRTSSQIQMQEQVQGVLERLGAYYQSVDDLHLDVSQLSRNIKQNDIGLKDGQQLVQSCRKRALNCGEDLLQDTLALDKLTGLFPEDRAQRKKAIATLDVLLEKVDAAKAELQLLDKVVSSKNVTPRESENPACEALAAERIPSDEVTASDFPDFEIIDSPMPFQAQPKQTTSEAPTEEDSSMEDLSEEEEDSMEVDSSNEVREASTGSVGGPDARVQRVMLRLSGHRVSVQRLQDKIERLAARLRQAGACVDEERRVCVDCQKLARNIVEDLMEDIVALDDLTDLCADDRSNRKHAIATLESHLGDLDRIKSHLVTLQEDVDSRLHAPLSPAGCEDSQAETCSHVDEATSTAVLPNEEFWQKLKLPLHFEPFESRSCYTLTCKSSNLQSDEINLHLNRAPSRLTVSGVHVPTASELEEMTTRIRQYLSKLGEDFEDQAVLDLYARIGSGSFGEFSETFQLPRDVDVSRISASCNDGVLHLRMPKRMNHARPMMGRSFF